MSEEQTPIPEQAQLQPGLQPSPKRGFSGKQVVGIVLGVLLLLAVGVAIGGAIGYRMGTAEGARQALASVPAFRSQSQRTPGQQTPNQQLPNQQTPRSFTVPSQPFNGQPFNGQQLPAVNPGGPYLGVTFETITPALAAQEGITGTTGALVREVAADGPAAQAGLKQGDVITAVNGKAVDAQNDLRARVAEFKPNDEITLTVVKGTANGPTDQGDVKVKLGERPAAQSFNFQFPFDQNGQPQLPDGFPQLPFGGQGQSGQAPATTSGYLGVELDATSTVTQGVSIKSVVTNGPAAKAGLKAGDVITAVDGKNIGDAAALRDIIQNHKSGDEITLTVVTITAAGPTNQHDVKVTLAARPAQQFQMPPSLPGTPGLDSREG
jgi:membrane-associated protease RseP (regulator of RpoE activity)